MKHALADALASQMESLVPQLADDLAALAEASYGSMPREALLMISRRMFSGLINDLTGLKSMQQANFELGRDRAKSENYHIEDFKYAHTTFQHKVEQFLVSFYGPDEHAHAQALPLINEQLSAGVHSFYEAYAQERERALLKTEQEFRALFSAMNDIVILFDREGRYLKIAPTNLAQQYGLDNSLLGNTAHNTLPKVVADTMLAAIQRTLERQQMTSFEYYLENGSGGFWFAAAVSPLNEESVVLVARDITDQKALEEDRRRAEVQQEILHAQEAVLAELSTPLIPITDEIVVMPLIGSIDSRRAEQVIVSLIEGVAASGARVAILDITGVPVVDTHVANALIQAARSVRLLGADVILTGIRPEVAQTLVGLGVDLNTLETQSDLRQAIAHAMQRR